MPETDLKRAYVFNALENRGPDDIFVFPSEISLRWWMEEYARASGAVEGDIGIAADNFLVRFNMQATGKPIHSLTRRLFVHTADLSLPALLPPGISSASLRALVLSFLAKKLPALKDDLPLLGKGREKEDWQKLYRTYLSFLGDHGLYEPGYYSPQAPSDGKIYKILFPSSSPRISPVLAADFPSVVPIPEPEGERPEITRYKNVVAEVNITLREIARLLDGTDGKPVPARDIVISVAKPDTMIPLLRRRAAWYGVPLVFRYGTSPLESPAGRFFRQISDLYASAFAYDEMEAFLLKPAIPWKEGEVEIHRKLLESAVERCVDGGSLDPADDAWLSVLPDRSLRDWYGKFRLFIISLNEARSAGDFWKALSGFQDAYLVPGGWHDPVAQFCYNRILEVGRILAEEGGFTELPMSFLSLLLEDLEHSRYVPRSEKKGISVYEWTAAASIAVPYHYALSLDWESVQVHDRNVTILPDGDRGADLTEATLKCLSLSPVRASWHEEDSSSSCVAPLWFVSEDPIRPAVPDPYGEEGNVWTGKGTEALAAERQEKAFAARQEIASPESPGAKGTLETPTCPPGWNKEISATKIDAVSDCAFAAGAKYVLGAEDWRKDDFSPSAIRPMDIGNIVHDAFRNFFLAVKEDGPHGGFLFPKPEGKIGEETDEEVMGRLFDEALERKFPRLNPAAKTYIVARYRQACIDFVENEKELLREKGTTVKDIWLEKDAGHVPFQAPDGTAVTLQGRADCIQRLTDGTILLIDYKLKPNDSRYPVGPKLARDKREDFDKKFKTVQLSFYDLVIPSMTDGEAEGNPRTLRIAPDGVDEAWYYFVAAPESGKKKVGFREAWDKTGGRENVWSLGKECTEERIGKWVAGAKSGKWNADCAEKEEAGCGRCSYRKLCRARYVGR